MVVEVVVAVVSGSLALISDAGHMLTDAGAIGASLWAIRLAARPARGVWTFGWKRAEILSAAVNGLTLLVVGALVAFEAIRRLIQPPPVAGGSVLVVALARGGGEPGCRVGPGQGEPVKLERPWCLSAHPDRPVRVHRHVPRRRGDRVHRLRPGRCDRVADRGRADVPCRVGAVARLRAGPARGRTWERNWMRSAIIWPPTSTSSTFTTCTCGRSPRTCPRCRRTW